MVWFERHSEMLLIASLFLVDLLSLTNTVLMFQNSWVIRAEKLFKNSSN
jgi:hypothetical protein